MKEKAYKNAQLKRQLALYKAQGKKELIWKLSIERKEYIENLGYTVEPYLFEITTKPFHNIRLIKYSLIRDVYYKNKYGKRTFTRKLNKYEQNILSEYGVKFRTVKYKIYLH